VQMYSCVCWSADVQLCVGVQMYSCVLECSCTAVSLELRCRTVCVQLHSLYPRYDIKVVDNFTHTPLGVSEHELDVSEAKKVLSLATTNSRLSNPQNNTAIT